MKKSLLLAALFGLLHVHMLRAQSLFSAPSVVCINQPVTLVPDSLAYNAMSYYWGFCSGYLMNAPTGTNLGDSFQMNIPTGINIAEDSGNYYGFVVNSNTTELLRYNFGNSLANTPTVTNFGNLTNGLPTNPTSLFIVEDPISREWFVFVTGGFQAGSSTLGRVDFGTSLANPHPNVANFENYTGLLDYPTGVFVAQDTDGEWWGFLVNHANGHLIHLDFSFNISNTPLMYDYGSLGSTLTDPTDLVGTEVNGKWYLFATNEGAGSDIVRINLDSTLNPNPTTISDSAAIITDDLNSPTFNSRILQPSSISINKDCGGLYAYITDSTTSQLVAIDMTTVTGPYNAIDYNNVGLMNYPSSISSILRDGNSLYGFITNSADSTLTRVSFLQCDNATIPSYTALTPPTYEYDSPGIYNVYFVINQGLPNMQVDCETITVTAYPPILLKDDTTICQGDSAKLYATSNFADSIIWQAASAIDTFNQYADSVRVYPQFSTRYPIIFYFPNGCIIDTAIYVNVNEIKADAGPDRWIKDGASTTLGGPMTSMGQGYTYDWSPFEYLSDSTSPFPNAQPPFDFTYYLTVSDYTVLGEGDTMRCVAKDTVNVYLNCGDVYLPNAFAPGSSVAAVATFGLLNQDIAKLNSFLIFNRWGAQVFETTDPTVGWDGTFNGQPAPFDVYVWVVDAFCLDGKEIKKSGNVTLIR